MQRQRSVIFQRNANVWSNLDQFVKKPIRTADDITCNVPWGDASSTEQKC